MDAGDDVKNPDSSALPSSSPSGTLTRTRSRDYVKHQHELSSFQLPLIEDQVIKGDDSEDAHSARHGPPDAADQEPDENDELVNQSPYQLQKLARYEPLKLWCQS